MGSPKARASRYGVKSSAMVLPTATPTRPSNAQNDCEPSPPPAAGVVQSTAPPSDAVSRTNGAVLPSSSARNDPVNVRSGPGDSLYEATGVCSVPARVDPSATP